MFFQELSEQPIGRMTAWRSIELRGVPQRERVWRFDRQLSAQDQLGKNPRCVDTICAMVKSRYIGDGHPTFNRNPYNGYINPYGIGLMTIPYYVEIMGV